MHSGLLRDVLFQTGLRLCNKPYVCFGTELTLNRPVVIRYTSAQVPVDWRGSCSCVSRNHARTCFVGSVCCSEDTSVRGPNVFKN